MTSHAPAVQFATNKEALCDREAAAAAERAMSFGPFLLVPKRRLLLKAHKSLRLGSRAFDILIMLVERSGELVSREEIMARVWPSTFVAPANLTVHISALRRALDDGREGNRYLVNIPGRGYRFVAPVFIAEEPTLSPAQSIATNHAPKLPLQLTSLVGDPETIRSLVTRMSQEGTVLRLRGGSALSAKSGPIEFEFATGARMRIMGPVDASTIAAIVIALAKAERR
jgi:DNA-binding winged helix-turn-helix (wHTH) protein